MTAPPPDDGAARNEPAIFGERAVALRRGGLAVLPANGKRPLIRNFQKMRCAPGLATVEQWALTNAYDNIVYVPGLSRTRRHGLVVVDADNALEVERVDAAPEGSLGNVGSLRKVGFDVDIKHGQNGSGISVAPPSRHPDQKDFAYAWHEGSGPDALANPPPFNVKALQELVTRGNDTFPDATGRGNEMFPNVTGTAPQGARGQSKLHCDSRGLGINRFLAFQAGFCDTFDEVLDTARTWNDNLANTGVQPLDDGEVIQRTTAVWADYQSGKLVRTHGYRAIAITDADEVRHLAKRDNGAEAVTLLLLLRAEHSAKHERGKTFALDFKAMCKKETLGLWSPQRYREARDTLLSEGLIEQVSDAGFRVAAQYRLCKRRPKPSVSNEEASDSG